MIGIVEGMALGLRLGGGASSTILSSPGHLTGGFVGWTSILVGDLVGNSVGDFEGR